MEPIEEIKEIEEKLLKNANWTDSAQIDEFISNLEQNGQLDKGNENTHSHEMLIQFWLHIKKNCIKKYMINHLFNK